MENTLKLNMDEFTLPEDAKVTKVFDRLMKINAAVTNDGVNEIYYESHSVYEESYAIGMF